MTKGRPLKLFCLWAALLFSGCEAVKPYQRVYLSDHEMKPGIWGARKFEEHIHAYREGASGGGSSKSSGGCGCN
ncbi:MAG: DUF4266 domain-containing protein [Bacteroidota bacterium]